MLLIIILNLNYYVFKFYIHTEMSGATTYSVVNHLSCYSLFTYL